MKHDWTADLLTYWDRLRGTRAAPDRSDVSPRALGGKLPNIFILRGDSEHHDLNTSTDKADIPLAKQWHFRLAGTRLCTIYSRELRNTRFLSLWHEDIRPWLGEQLHLSGLDYRPLRLEHTGVTLNEKTCHFETLLLPLHETDGSPAWIGSMVALEQPLWLGSDPLISNHMGFTVKAAIGAIATIETPSVAAPSGMKSVLQVLLDRHHELTPEQAYEKAPRRHLQNHGENENTLPNTTEPVSNPVQQSEAVMPSVYSAEQAVFQSGNSISGSAPLTVADLIKSIHPATQFQETARAPSKPMHLKVITGGKSQA